GQAGPLMRRVRIFCPSDLHRRLATSFPARRSSDLVYLRGHEGRGIGLGHKLRAYSLQESGHDTVDANTALGLPVDSREYGIGAQDRKSTRLNSSHVKNSYAVFCLKKKTDIADELYT